MKFIGNPCRKCGATERYCSSKGCVACAAARHLARKAHDNAASRNWYHTHREQARAANRRWRSSPKGKASSARSYQLHRAEKNQWRKKNKEKIKAYRHRHYWANPEQSRAASLRWYHAHKEQVHEAQRRHRTTEGKAARMQYNHLYYRTGPRNPSGEASWLRKNQAQLRAVKRLLRTIKHGGAWQSHLRELQIAGLMPN